jgi:hypothetical protein
VLDARDVLNDAARLVPRLCERLGVEFLPDMLHWPPGLRETDGVWAKHWYQEVETSTSFRPYRPKPDVLPEEFAELHAQCVELYGRLYEHRLR